MFKLVPAMPLQLKQYWCADHEVAEQVANELEGRYGCDCRIVEVPERQAWASGSEKGKDFVLERNLQFRCTEAKVQEALRHARGDVLKISDTEEIFCFAANDQFWQSRYATDC